MFMAINIHSSVSFSGPHRRIFLISYLWELTMSKIYDLKRWLSLAGRPIGILRCAFRLSFSLSLSCVGLESQSFALHHLFELEFIKSFSIAPAHKSLNFYVNSH